MKAIARSIPTSREVVCCCRIIVHLSLDQSALRAVLERREHRFATRELGNNSIHGRGQTLMPLTEAFHSNRTVAMSDHPEVSPDYWNNITCLPTHSPCFVHSSAYSEASFLALRAMLE